MVNMIHAQNSNNSLLISEILDKVHKAKTKSQKIEILRKNDTSALRMIIKGHPLTPLKNGSYLQVKFLSKKMMMHRLVQNIQF